MNPLAFLQAELDHAQRHLTRIRRIQTKMQQDLEQAGLDEFAVYEKLATHKTYRQLGRDELVFQQMWLRVHRQLERLRKTTPKPSIEETFPDIFNTPAKPQPYRKPPTPGPNEKCHCGSGIKYKKCCGNPLRRQAQPAAA